MSETLILNRSFTRDPHGILHRLQSDAPISRALAWGDVPVWLITRYDDAKSLLTDPRLTTDRRVALKVLPANRYGQYASELSQHMLHSDPPDHTRLRKLVTKAFTPKAVDRLKPAIEAIADDLLDAIDTNAPVDMISGYAGPLSARVIGELLGVPADFRDRFQVLLDPLLDPSVGQASNNAVTELTAMLTELIADRRRQPREDLMSGLIEASSNDDRLKATELLGTAYLLISAGYDTTVNLIGNGILALLRAPSQMAALRADSLRLSTAVEEFLRIGSPVNLTVVRFTTEPIRVRDVDIPKHQIVLISLLAANHDGARFNDPDRLDISRKPNSHLAFGRGIHHCVGAPLARLEGRIAFARLLARFPHLELATTEPLEYRHNILLHGLRALPVRCDRNPPNGHIA